MIRRWRVTVYLALGVVGGLAVLASGAWVRLGTPVERLPHQVVLKRLSGRWYTQAQSAIVAVANGPVIYRRNADIKRPIASVTKMMTAYVVLTHPTIYPEQRLVTITASEVLNDRQGLAKGDSEVPLRVGEKVSVKNLLVALMLPSADDAAWVLAHSYPGGAPAFIRVMNRTAAALGMNATHYVDPDGVNHLGYSTANNLLALINRDMAIGTFRQLVRTKTAETSFGRLSNLNQLLWRYPGAIGIKTGWTPWAGSCLAFAAVRRHDGQRLTLEGVVLNEPSFGVMFNDVKNLLNLGFYVLRYQVVFTRGETVAEMPLMTGWWRRPIPPVRLVLAQSVGTYPLQRSARVQVRWTLGRAKQLRQGEIVGYLRLQVGSRHTPWVAIKATRSVQAGWF
ncbi:MAG: D-alanyl-D-alanine carboxypeptidase [Firmicutes bacterium]|nr:D-alanyl-D-alanine carboxypeptidase [Bacillota bacterium]